MRPADRPWFRLPHPPRLNRPPAVLQHIRRFRPALRAVWVCPGLFDRLSLGVIGTQPQTLGQLGHGFCIVAAMALQADSQVEM